MNQTSFLVALLIFGISTSLFAYSFCLAFSSSPLFLNEAIAQQDLGSQISVSQESGLEGQEAQGSDGGGTSQQCPPNQHNVGSTSQCEWDNCGSATPPMYRNTQTGRCVSDCSEVGQYWVKQGNTCVPSRVSNLTSTQTPPTISSESTGTDGSKNGTIQSQINSSDLTTENTTARTLPSNVTSSPSNLTKAVATLVGEPALPYACFSDTFTCYCDGTQDCKKLASSGECKAEVRTVEGKPGLGDCDWNANS